MPKKVAKFGWFSAEQAKVCGTVFYERLEGGEVECSTVSNTGDHGTSWPDIKFVGEVLEFKRRGQPDPYGFINLLDDYDDGPDYSLDDDIQ